MMALNCIGKQTTHMDIFGVLSVPEWLLILLILLVSYYIYMTWESRVFKKMGVPVAGGKHLPILGHIPKYQKQGSYICDTEWVQKYGLVYGVFERSVPVLVVSDTEMLKQILVKDFDNFCDRRDMKGLSGDLEYSLINLKGEHWKYVRSIMTPAFSTGKLKLMTPDITKASKNLVNNLKLKLKETNIQDIKRVFGAYSMDVIASTVFGIEVDSQSNPDDPIYKNAVRMFNFSFTRFFFLVLTFLPFLQRLFGKLGLTFYNRSSGQFFKQLILKIIKEREQAKNKKDYKDYLQLMIEAKLDDNKSDDRTRGPSWKGLSKREIVGQAMLFITAGFETTGTTLCMLAYNLALNPAKQQKLYEEVIEKLGLDNPNYDNVQNLPFLKMCINETLRLFPPFTRIDRVCKNDTEIQGVKIPRGMHVTVPIYGLQHSPNYWEDPEEFKPERFSPEERTKINPLHFAPFGVGPRNCIGIRLSYLEAKVATVDFVRNFRVSTCEKTQIPPKFPKMGMFTPEDVLLNVEERN